MPALPPPRARTPSGHDVPIPESVFQALHSVQAEHAGTRAEVAGLRSDVAEIKEAVAKLAAAGRSETAKIIGGVLVAALGVIGGQKALAPTPPAPEVRAVRSADDLALDECRPLRPGSYERAECFERVSGMGAPGRRAAR